MQRAWLLFIKIMYLECIISISNQVLIRLILLELYMVKVVAVAGISGVFA